MIIKDENFKNSSLLELNYKQKKLILDNLYSFSIFNILNNEIEDHIKVYDDYFSGNLINISNNYLVFTSLDNNIPFLYINNFLSKNKYNINLFNLFNLSNIQDYENYNIHLSNISSSNICISFINENVFYILIYDMETQVISKLLKNTFYFNDIINYCSKTSVIILYNKNEISIIDLNRERLLFKLNYPFDSLGKSKLSSDEKYLALIIPETESDKFREKYSESLSLLMVYDLEKRQFLYDISSKFTQLVCVDYIIRSIYFTNNNKHGISYISQPGIIIIFELETGKVLVLKENISSATYDTESDMIAYILKGEENIVNIDSFDDFLRKE